jgi:hypothetical protein
MDGNYYFIIAFACARKYPNISVSLLTDFSTDMDRGRKTTKTAVYMERISHTFLMQFINLFVQENKDTVSNISFNIH